MTSDTANNQGIQVFGGTLNAQAVAVGAGASAVVNNAVADLKAAGRDEVLETLKQVLAALEAHGAALPDKATAEALVERIATEAARDTPDKLTVKSFLANLADEVKSVASIAAAVAPLAGAVMALF